MYQKLSFRKICKKIYETGIDGFKELSLELLENTQKTCVCTAAE